METIFDIIDFVIADPATLLIALVFVTINLIVDLLYYVVDPRLRIEQTATSH